MTDERQSRGVRNKPQAIKINYDALNAERAAEERKVGRPEQAAPAEEKPTTPKSRKDDKTLDMFGGE